MTEQIRHDAADSRYVATVNGEEAGFVSYTDLGDRITLDHTIVHPAHQGKGLAGRLAAHVLDDLRTSTDARIEPHCSYLVDYLGKHPEYADLTTRRG